MRFKPLAAAFLLAAGLLGPDPSSFGAAEAPAGAAGVVPPLANLDFEQGEVGQEPPGWHVPQGLKEKGYAAVTVTERPESGARCAVLTAPAPPTSQAGPGSIGILMRSFDAAPYRGKRVRFRAAVRVEGEGDRGQLWLRVDRPGDTPGFFDNMGDRPVTSAAWARYEIVGQIAADAATINLGLIHSGGGRAWLDSASFEILGPAGVGNEPARPLSARGLDNVVAFTRLLGDVRYFHPSDPAASLGTDGWNRFALAGVQTVEAAAGPEELARALSTLFLPIAPTVRVFPAGQKQVPAAILAAAAEDPKARQVFWRHLGLSLGMDTQGGAYQSVRIDNQSPDKAPDGEPLPTIPPRLDPSPIDLGGGVQAFVPPILPTDAQGKTLPRVPDGVRPKAPEKPEGFLPSGDDRATRLADVALAWNVFEHFYPYFDVVEADWPAELRRALQSAATDPDATAFRNTLSRLVAALHDGHGSAGAGPGLASRQLPLLWEWVEGRLVVTQVDREHGGGPLAPGDVVTAIDGRPTAEILAEREALRSGATPQWRRYRSVVDLAVGAPGSVRLTVEHVGGEKTTVSVERSLPVFGPGAIEEKRPEKIAEVAPGILYVDIGRITDDDWKGSLDRLAKARGIVFDFRGYPNSLSPSFLQNLSDQPLQSAQWRIPLVTRPDHAGWTFHEAGRWNLTPLPPHLTARLAFVTDGRAISYAESCLGIVEAYKLGAIVGGPTAGTNGNINPFALPGGYRLVWTGMQVLKHDGSRHHGVGILPTVPVARTRAGVAAGRDELLEKAIEVVSK